MAGVLEQFTVEYLEEVIAQLRVQRDAETKEVKINAIRRKIYKVQAELSVKLKERLEKNLAERPAKRKNKI